MKQAERTDTRHLLDGAAQPAGRRAYREPQLTAWGSLAELTLGPKPDNEDAPLFLTGTGTT